MARADRVGWDGWMDRDGSGQRRRPRGLLLDIGGVVLRHAIEMVGLLAQLLPDLAPVVDRVGGFASKDDELWAQIESGEVTERHYWAVRAQELGAAVGEKWDTKAMIHRMYDLPSDRWLRPEVLDLMSQVRTAGVPLGALTNDLADFHGDAWVAQQDWLRVFDVVVDASKTGIYKPDPRAYAAGAAALGLHPEEIVYLDDMAPNLVAGKLAGLQTVAVDYHHAGRAVQEARRLLGLTEPVARPA